MQSIFKKTFIVLSVFLLVQLLPIESKWSTSRAFTAISLSFFDIFIFYALLTVFKIIIDELNEN